MSAGALGGAASASQAASDGPGGRAGGVGTGRAGQGRAGRGAHRQVQVVLPAGEAALIGHGLQTDAAGPLEGRGEIGTGMAAQSEKV